jgi:glutamate-1-semialdehyde 2,1-aminomutase
MVHKKSMEIFERAKDSIPGGVNSPVRAFQSVKKAYPIFINRGKGSKIYDEDGNEYLDCICSWGPMILGHNDERVVEAVKKEVENGSSFGLPTKKEVELAELVKECFPSIEKIRLTTSGTEATMAAVRLARAYTKKNKILKFEGCYHGHSDSLMVKAGSGLLTSGHQDSNGITTGVMQDTLTLPFGDLNRVRRLLESEDDMACIIVEPVPANMGLVIPDEKFLKGLRELCDEHGVVLIFDEVISGFRLSIGGAQKIYGINPDLTTLGKIIGGGYPVGAFGGKKEIMDMVAPIGNVYHAGTLSGNPVSVRAGIETLKILKNSEGLYENLEAKTAKLAQDIREIARKYTIPVTVNQIGSLFTIFFSKKEVKNLEDAIDTNDDMYVEYFSTMLEEGIIVPPAKYEAHFISAAHSSEDLAKILAAIEKAFENISKKVSR